MAVKVHVIYFVLVRLEVMYTYEANVKCLVFHHTICSGGHRDEVIHSTTQKSLIKDEKDDSKHSSNISSKAVPVDGEPLEFTMEKLKIEDTKATEGKFGQSASMVSSFIRFDKNCAILWEFGHCTQPRNKKHSLKVLTIGMDSVSVILWISVSLSILLVSGFIEINPGQSIKVVKTKLSVSESDDLPVYIMRFC